MSNKLPTIGFLGSGAITTAMVTGFCERAADTSYPLIVSDMRLEASEALAKKYPHQVYAAESLQECVDKADWVVIAVWLQAGEQVIRSLTFRPNHKIINAMFDKTVEEIKTWLNCEVDTMLHMIPGTFLSFYPGPIVQCPPTPEAAEIFGKIGTIVNVSSRYHAAVFGSITGCFAPMFAILDHLIDWAESEGVPADAATQYVTNMFAAVCQEACGKDREGVHYMATVSTPGGINLQAFGSDRQSRRLPGLDRCHAAGFSPHRSRNPQKLAFLFCLLPAACLDFSSSTDMITLEVLLHADLPIFSPGIFFSPQCAAGRSSRAYSCSSAKQG